LTLSPRQPEVHRPRDRRRIATDRVAVVVEHVHLVAIRVGREERYVPTVGMTGRRAQRELLARATDPQRQPLLDGLRLAPGVMQLEELAVEVRYAFGEQRADALDALVEHAKPNGHGRERDAVRVVLTLVPAAP